MRKLFLFLMVAAMAALAVPGFAQGKGMKVGLNFGGSWALAGDSPIVRVLEPQTSFKEDFDMGWTLGFHVAGPFTEMLGWRGEFGYDKMSADADFVAGKIDGDYKIYRYQAGLEISPFRSAAKGKPYGFVTLGGMKEDASLNVSQGNLNAQYDFNGENAFGMSFGGGYNYMIGTNWGIGGDLHFNYGWFDSGTRWWWAPTGQVVYNW